MNNSRIAILAVICCLILNSRVQSQTRDNVLPTDARVDFVRSSASPMEAIVSIASQTRIPLAILFGENRQRLCSSKQKFVINNSPPKEALAAAVQGTGYELRNDGDVIELIAPDLTAWQRELLGHKFADYHFRPNAVLNALFTQLQGALLMDAEGAAGYAGSTLYAPTAERFTLSDVHDNTTEQIANRLVSLDGHALWIFRAGPEPTKVLSGDQFDIYSYRDDLALIQSLTCP